MELGRAKARFADVGDFVAAFQRVASGGSAIDPEVVKKTRARYIAKLLFR